MIYSISKVFKMKDLLKLNNENITVTKAEKVTFYIGLEEGEYFARDYLMSGLDYSLEKKVELFVVTVWDNNKADFTDFIKLNNEFVVYNQFNSEHNEILYKQIMYNKKVSF